MMNNLASRPDSTWQPAVLQSNLLGAQTAIRHGFSSQIAPDGTTTPFTLAAAHPDGVLNRNKMFHHLQMPADHFTPIQQVHGCSVVSFDTRETAQKIPEADAAITALSGVPLMVVTADCVPVLLFDQKNKVIAAIHAGWRGTLQQITAHTIEQMQSHYQTNPANIWAAIGPSIGPCCYEVGKEVHEAFEFNHPDGASLFTMKHHKPHLDLWRANRLQLLGAGVPDAQIDCLNQCTCCQPNRYFSVRASGSNTGRQGAFILLQ